MTIRALLEQREEQGSPIRVGIVGAGQMGTGLICQLSHLPGMRTVAVADIEQTRVRDAYRLAGISPTRVTTTDDLRQAQAALADGRVIATQRASLLPQLPGLDVVVEATGIPSVGALVAVQCILHRKHVVMLNVEADVTVGPILSRLAESAGVVYTGAAGDEPAATLELCEFAWTLGFEVIAAGKGKNNPLDRTATPDRLTDEAREKNMSPKMLCSFVDGTKTMVEMTALANATGLIPDVRGMHGPQATLDDLPRIFAPREEGGILSRTGVVEYVLGDVAPGVFVVITTQDPVIAADLRYLRLGPGPRWVLYRPYHLANLEVPLSVARAVLLNEPTICPRPRPVAEAITIAKRDLHAGEQIDGLGGFTVYGSIDRAETAREEGLLPLGLAPGSVLRRDVPQGAPLHLSDVELDKNQMIVALRRMQDRLLYAEL